MDEKQHRGTLIASGLMFATAAIGAVAYLIHLDREEFRKKVEAVHSYVQKNGEMDVNYNGQTVRVFAEGGLGMELNRRPSLASTAYEVAVQGASKLAKDVVKNTLGMRREGDGIDLSGKTRVLPEFSDCITDNDLDGIDSDDTYKEWKYDPTLRSKKEQKSSTYVARMKGIGKLVRDVSDAVKGNDIEEEKEEVIIEKKLHKNTNVRGLSPGKQDSLRKDYREIVEQTYEQIPKN